MLFSIDELNMLDKRILLIPYISIKFHWEVDLNEHAARYYEHWSSESVSEKEMK